MRPNERRQTGQSDLFRARLDQIVDLDHPVVKLAAAIDWGFLEEQFGPAGGISGAVFASPTHREIPRDSRS